MIRTTFDVTNLQKLLLKEEKLTEAPDFWNDNQKAQVVLQNLNYKKKKLEFWQNLVQEIQDIKDFVEILEEGSPELDEIVLNLEKLEKSYEKAHLELFLNGKYDQASAILNLTAGTGGTDAQDWAEMLLRMYLRYAEKHGFKVTIMDKQMGSEAGIKSCLLKVSGVLAYGYLKAEKGVHRLVRLSPFNAKNLRQTSFALLEVYPEITSNNEIEIDLNDLKIDTFRASGAGGQHVNTTDSAVRITHLPSGIVVQCQNERSQLQNREQAMQILTSRLAEQKLKEEEKHHADLKGEHQAAAWGNQIRSYVLHPYKMVKDHRTEIESSQVEKVLDGEIDVFIEGWLQQKV